MSSGASFVLEIPIVWDISIQGPRALSGRPHFGTLFIARTSLLSEQVFFFPFFIKVAITRSGHLDLDYHVSLVWDAGHSAAEVKGHGRGGA